MLRSLIQRWLNREPKLIDWGFSHPKETLIQAAVPTLEDPDANDIQSRSISRHLVGCKPCAELVCGYINQARKIA